MDPTLQVDPERCVFVIGPQVAAAALSLPDGIPRVLSYAMLVDLGVQKMLEYDKTSTYEEKSRKLTSLANAYELEPAFAASKVVETLKDHGLYKQWLNDQFSKLLSMPVSRSGGIVDQLHNLQEKGALLVYSYYDTTLDRALNTAPITLGDEEAVKSWANHQNQGLLHIHGTYTEPDLVTCDCVNYQRLVGETSGGQILKEACRNRSVLFIGFDGEFYDPFVPKFAKTFLGPLHPPPLLISSIQEQNSSLEDYFLTLRLSQISNLDRLFFTVSPLPRSSVRDSIDRKISTTLLYHNKASCLAAAERVKVTSGINVHQLTMTHEHLYHHLLLYLDREGLKELWKILFPGTKKDSSTSSSSFSSSSLGLHTGLLGVMMDSIVVWLKKVGVVAQPTPMDTGQGTGEYVALSLLHHTPPRSLHPPSLTTNLALIGSTTGSPIVTPSVSRPSNSTCPTLPSPLISSTSRGLLGSVTTKGSGETQMNLLSPMYSSSHGQVRRVQSERSHLSYRDCITKHEMKRQNGILLHTESAPNFIRTSDGLLMKDPSLPNTHISSVNHASPLLRDGSHMEVKIERVDQMQHGSGGASSPASSPSRGEGALRNNHRVAMSSSSDVKEFTEERQKFISEAQSWSRLVDSEIAKKVKPVSSQLHHQEGLSMGGAFPLSLFTSPGGAGHTTSLSSKFSQEEREKLLQQHFERITQQHQHHQHVSATAHTPQAAASLSKLPLNTLSISTTHQGHTHSPHLSPHQLSRAPSPKKSPINPFQPVTGTASGLFPFLSQAASLNPANFLCNNFSLPSAAAMFNYQAALQLMATAPGKQQQQQQQQQQQNPPIMATPEQLVLQNFMDKIPIILPDGTMTFLTTTTTAATGAASSTSDVPGNSSAAPPTTSSSRGNHHQHHQHQDSSPEDDSVPSPSPPPQASEIPHNYYKRTRSPDSDQRSEVLRGSPPKRRRSCSLPDITQLSQVTSRGSRKEDIKEEEKEEVGGTGGGGLRIPLSSDELRPCQLAPPTMIHIPQDMNDPMLGFPTPTQSSPLAGGNFGLSPIVFSAPTFHPHQPMTPVTPNQDSKEMGDLVEAGGYQTTLPPSPEGSNLPPFPAGRGPIQLWQFLLDLLLSPDQQHLIHWTGNGYEFKILQPEEIAKLWGTRKNKPRMNYDKLSRGLRYYYSKGIMDKVQGKKLTFKYTCDVQNYVRSRNSQLHGASSRGGVDYRAEDSSSTPPLVTGRSDGMKGEESMEEMGVVSGGVGGDREQSFGVLELGHRDVKRSPNEILSSGSVVGVVQDEGGMVQDAA